ncbi:TetR/AcrR family transcriptional regulator [Rhodococcus fascians]|nr:TetR/AcrR family transcriptional regulator [Rhodococcus fascians]MBY4114693.1 TetR/AcrR family transcriptional regulator [Rhodococcus fascians]
MPEPPPSPRSQVDSVSAFELARRTFIRGDKLDMQELATELGVDRSTLFRWVGNKDTLQVNVLRSLAESTERAILATASGTGGTRIADIAASYADALIGASYFRDFLRREPERSLKLITTKASPLQQQAVSMFQQVLEHEIAHGRLAHSLGAHDLAYLVVRIMESFTYADIITDDEPDASKVRTAVCALLHVDTTSTEAGAAARVYLSNRTEDHAG